MLKTSRNSTKVISTIGEKWWRFSWAQFPSLGIADNRGSEKLNPRFLIKTFVNFVGLTVV